MPITAFKPSFIPTTIPNVVQWLDSTDLTTITLSGSNVTAWNDKSGNGNHMTTSNGNPTYTSNAINGLPVMNLTNSSGFISSATPTLTTNLSLAMVVVVQSGIANWGAFFTHGGRDFDFALEQNGIKGNTIHFQTGNDNSGADIVYTAGNPVLYLGTMTGGTSRFFEAITAGTTTTTTATNGSTMSGGTQQLIRIGRSDGNESCNSYIAEVIYFNSVLTDTQRQQIEGYLTWKWGLQASLSNGHPYRATAPNSIPSIPFSLPSIAGCQLWLDGSDITTRTYSGSDIIAWNDKSGNAYHMNVIAQGSAAGAGTYPSNGTAINGLPTLLFSPTAGLKQGTLLDGVKHLFWVGRISAANTSYSYFLLGGQPYVDWHAESYGGRYFDAVSGAALIGSSSPASQFTNDARAAYNVAYSTIYFPSAPNVALLSLSGVTGSTRYDGICYDRGNHCGWCGDLAEVITYSNVLSTTQVQQIEGYLSWKWGLQTYLPGGHPYRASVPRVLLTNPFTPKSIVGCTLWVDAADPAGTGVMPANGASLTTWVDKSGTGTNLTGNGSPTLGTYNGLRIVNFSSSYFQNTSYTQSGPLTIIFIGKMNAGADWQTFSDNVSGVGPYVGLQIETPNKRTAFRYGGTATTNVEIWTLTYSSSDNTVFNVNGTDVRGAGVGYGGIGFTNGVRLGYAGNNSSYLNGWIGEYFIYNTALTITQYQQIEGYLAWKWGLQVSLPGTHPYLGAAPTAGLTINNKISALPFHTQFKPTSIAGCCLWLDGADQTNFTFSSGSNINNWTDKSGNSNTFTTSQGTVTYSNKSAYFNGSSMMTNTSQTGFALGSSVSMIRFVVFNTTSVATAGAIFSYGNNTVGAVIYVDTDSNVYGTSYSGVFSIKNPISINTNYLVSDFYSNNGTPSNYTHYGWLNGTPYSTNGTTSTTLTINPSNPAYVGGAIGNISPFNGYIYEIIFYNKALTTTERQSVESYLAAKWGLTSALPNFSNPLSISGCRLWLDAADSSSFTLSGSTLLTIKDKSASNNSMTVASAPTYSATGFNSKPCFVLASGNSITCPLSNVTTQDIMMVAVWKQTVNSMGSPFSLGGAGSGSEVGLIWHSGENRYLAYTYGGGDSHNSSVSFNVNVIQIGIKLSGNMSCWINGTVDDTVASSRGNIANTIYVGGGGWAMVGNLAEVLFYVGTVTTTQRQQLEGYLAAKWGLQSSLPLTHPYYIGSPLHSHFSAPAGRDPIVARLVPSVPRGIGYVPPLAVGGTVTPSVPTNTGTTLNMSWSAASGSVIAYTIYVLADGSLAPSGTLSLGNVTSTTFSPMVSGTVYSFYVVATGPGGPGTQSTTSLTVTYTAPPVAPTSITLASLTATGATVTWSGGSGASYFTCQIYSSASSNMSSPSTISPQTPSSSTSVTTPQVFTFSVTAGLYYGAIITAVNAGGSTASAMSTGVLYSAAEPPVAPTSITLASLTGSGATVTWSGGSGASYYTCQIYSSTASNMSSPTTRSQSPSSSTSVSSGQVFSFSVEDSLYYGAIVTAVNASGSAASSMSTGVQFVGTYSGLGPVTTLATGFGNLYNLAIDSAENIYLADYGGHKVWYIPSGGSPSIFAGSTSGYVDGAAGSAKFNSPSGVAVSSDGATVYVTDYGNSKIRKINGGTVTTLAGGTHGAWVDGASNVARFYYPSGIAIDRTETVLFIGDKLTHRIRVVTIATGAVTTLAGGASSSVGGAGAYADGTGASASFNSPLGVCVGLDNSVYVADSTNQRIRKVTYPEGVVTTVAGDGTNAFLNGTGTGARFSGPYGVAMDLYGILYVADKDSKRIRQITRTGVVTTFAGTGTNTSVDNANRLSATFVQPTGVVVNSTRTSLYVTQTATPAVRKITLS